MTTTATETTNDKRKERKAPPTAAQMLHALERNEPELFRPNYDAEAISDALIADGMPAPVLRDVVLFYVRMHQRDFNRPSAKPRLVPGERREAFAVKEAAAKMVAASIKTNIVQKGLATVGADFLMADGRRLGDWTIGELRVVGGVFAFILAKAGKADDSRKVEQIMRPGDWRKANA